MDAWYLLYTKPRWEFRVSFFLRERIGVPVYLPLWSRPGESQEDGTPFFPNYLFARLDFSSLPFYTFSRTPGLRGLPRLDHQLIVVPDDIIETIKTRLAQTRGEVYARGQLFRRGDRVLITKGPLRGYEALFDGRASGEERVRVLLQMLGQQVKAEVPLSCLEKLIFVVKPPRVRRTRGKGRRVKQVSQFNRLALAHS